MELVQGKKPHVLAVPFPAQGHVKPLMKLCRQIAKRGIKVTFVNIQSIHEKIVAAAKMSGEEEDDGDDHNLVLTSIPDGDQNDTFKLLDSLRSTMPGSLTDLIDRINGSISDEKISCVIADVTIGWVLETARKVGAEPVVFSPLSAAALAILFHVPKLLEEGNLDHNGTVKNGESIISLSENIPPWRKDELTWTFSSDLNTQKTFFECCKRIGKTANQAYWLLSNTFYELEPSACDLIPCLRPIGPLLDTRKSPKSSSTSNNSYNFHPEDASCISWLDTRPARSVIYVSFGSLAVFSQQQLDELAIGLEMSSRAFLWVVRADLANGSRAVYPDGYLERVSGFGKIVEWAPQEKVLSHCSIACFLSHCGWNSTLEGLNVGVPFLCWPYSGDQCHNHNYICDEWEIGLRIEPDENGMRSRHEIEKKIERMFCEVRFKENAMKIKETCEKSVSEGGCSYENLETFIDHLRK